MIDAKADELIVLPGLRANRGPRGGLVLTRKFVKGVAEYAKYWPGVVSVLVELDDITTSDMDHVEVLPAAGLSRFEIRPRTAEAEASRLSRAAVVLAFLSRREAPTAQMCRGLGVPLVYSSEYTQRTELQIIGATVANPLRRLRRSIWTYNSERKRLAAVRQAAGIQCSGTPTYEVYRHVNSNPLLFFDNRVPEADVISELELAQKLATLDQRRPLRLVFGGRLIAMKGVLDLPKVAELLARSGVEFTFEIFGDGELREHLQQDISRRGLDNYVQLRGVLDFESGWIPLLRSRMDLFVCCHPQGDPSSTYPEVMSCGVPIVGYDNEAFQGVVQHSDSGWLVHMRDIEGLARTIERLAADRGQIAAHARKARNFAMQHAFERTFKARVDHLASVARLSDRAPQAKVP